MEVEGLPDGLYRRARGEARASVSIEQGDGRLAGVGVHLEANHCFSTEGDADCSVSEQFAGVAVFGGGMHGWVWVGVGGREVAGCIDDNDDPWAEVNAIPQKKRPVAKL